MAPTTKTLGGLSMVFSPPSKVKKGSGRDSMPEQTAIPLMTLV